MTIWIYDFEVFFNDWLVVFKNLQSKEFVTILNDNSAVKDFIKIQRPTLVGFNNKHYDNYILKAVLADCSASEIKSISDYIIAGNQAWNHSLLKNVKTPWFDSFDLKDDCQVGISLKSFEAHSGMNIEESTVNFDIKRNLTDEEITEVLQYCKHDVDATEKLFAIRKDYLQTKLQLGELSGIPPEKSLFMTNAKLTAAFLKASPVKFEDEREYSYPDNLNREWIPDTVFEFFNQLHDDTISDDELFTRKFTGNIGDCSYTLGFGGIHGDCGNIDISSKDGLLIINEDVASYYPHLMTVNSYCSRAIPDPKIYQSMLNRRMEAKKNGDSKTANALKLVANTTYGAMLNQYNPLYDPLNGRSVCISGQLYLLELAYHLYSVSPDEIKIIQLNTDGIMFSAPEYWLDLINKITKEWQERTKFTLERDIIQRVIQKDVNNYIEIKQDGTFKVKGGYLVRGISKAGAFNINNNFNIVSQAVIDYFVKGIPLETTINQCDEILKFQIIAKASGKYSGVYQVVNGEKVDAQRCNRVYASKNKDYGTLYKTHGQTGKDAKIGGLPEHCIIDNKNNLSIESVDKSWYIELAQKYVNDYIGIKSTKQRKSKKGVSTDMAEKTKNIYEKLSIVRHEFSELSLKKSGINHYAEFQYFELSDIVPSATKLLEENKLLFLVSLDNNQAMGKLINTENSEQTIEITVPFTPIAEPKTYRMNEIQATGAAITYMRRYLYMLLLDIVEQDTVNAAIGKDEKKTKSNNVPSAPPDKPRKTIKEAQREDIKAAVTAASEAATELQINGLRIALKDLRKQNPDEENFIQGIVAESECFAKITKEQCEKWIQETCEKLKKGEAA